MGSKVKNHPDLLMRMRIVSLGLLLMLIAQWVHAVEPSVHTAGSLSVGGIPLQVDVVEGKLELTYARECLAEQPLTAQMGANLARLQEQTEIRLRQIQQLEQRQFDAEQLAFRGTRYLKALLEKISVLQHRLQMLGPGEALTQDIETAVLKFDLPEIMRLLQIKVSLQDDSLAEAAFQLGSFQELQGDYQDAWANYQIASSLQPDNQLYMDAHGKNQF